MNYEETGAVLAYFAGAWPKFELNDATVEVWIAEVADIDPTDANEAMHRLVRHEQWPPSIARFRQECLEIALARRNRFANRAGLNAGGEAVWPAELVEAMRGMLKEASAKAPAPRWSKRKDNADESARGAHA